jgi:hypothetical protein
MPNQNRNKPAVSKEKLAELGLIKVLGVVIPEAGEDLYRCVNDDGEIVVIPASQLGLKE